MGACGYLSSSVCSARWIAATLWTACGDTASAPALEIVGHADLGARGINAGLAVAGDTAYIGSRDDTHGIAIVDIANPGEHPDRG